MLQTGGYNDDLMGSDDDGAHDAYLERMKAEGKQRDEDDELETEDSSGTVFALISTPEHLQTKRPISKIVTNVSLLS